MAIGCYTGKDADLQSQCKFHMQFVHVSLTMSVVVGIVARQVDARCDDDGFVAVHSVVSIEHCMWRWSILVGRTMAARESGGADG